MSERLTEAEMAEALSDAQVFAPFVTEPKMRRTLYALLQVSGDLSEANIDRHNAKAFLKSENKDRWDAFLMLEGTNDHGHADECPTYYDGCHCSVDVLTHNIQRAEKAESALSALQEKAREVLANLELIQEHAGTHTVKADDPVRHYYGWGFIYDRAESALGALRALLPADTK